MLLFLAFSSGCNVVGYMATPTNSEKEIPAEYDIKDASSGGIVVLVDEARGSGAGFDLSSELGEAIKLMLVEKAGVSKKDIYVYDKMELLRESRDVNIDKGPGEIASVYDADKVLYVVIDDYGLYLQDQRGYYSGMMTAGAMILDADIEVKLWPLDEPARMARASVEFETGGASATTARLVRIVSHIITRSLYDCKKNKYKIADEVHYYDEQMMELRDL
jgi:hypothetical protein